MIAVSAPFVSSAPQFVLLQRVNHKRQETCSSEQRPASEAWIATPRSRDQDLNLWRNQVKMMELYKYINIFERLLSHDRKRETKSGELHWLPSAERGGESHTLRCEFIQISQQNASAFKQHRMKSSARAPSALFFYFHLKRNCRIVWRHCHANPLPTRCAAVTICASGVNIS